MRAFGVAGRSRWLHALIAFLLAWTILGSRDSFDVGLFDEGVALYGSLRVAEGALPYRDFWTVYGPGAYYLNASAFHVFGPSVGVVRKIWTLIHAVVTTEALIVGHILGGRSAGWLAFVAALAGGVAVSPHSGYPAVPALAAALAALIVVSSGRNLVIAGALGGLTAVFRQDFGSQVVVTVTAGLLLRTVSAHRKPAPEILRFLGGAGAVVVSVYGALALVAGIRPVVDQLLVFPLTVLPRYNALPIGNKPWLLISPLVLFVATAVIAARLWQSRHRPVNDGLLLGALLCAFGLGLLNYARFRFDAIHVWPLLIATSPFVAAAPFVLVSPWRRMAAITGLVTTLVIYASIAGRMIHTTATVPTVSLDGPRAAGIMIPRAFAIYNDLVRAVRSETRPGEPIFSGSTHHDRMYAHDVFLYFVAERPAPSPYHELSRGLVTTERVQREIVQALEGRDVRVLVLMDIISREPNRSSVSSGVTLLDDHIRDSFVPVRKFGPYELWRRR